MTSFFIYEYKYLSVSFSFFICEYKYLSVTFFMTSFFKLIFTFPYSFSPNYITQ
ncbi:hypothetical protein GLOIN_2v1609039 [Rhizophagus irregularis DAOM 181602=DAOM 197198]|uniref:Uncharacterized protein n=1 Tax=Rhizophagus irregularis (strain DAOM 181602 / DAOM 197198 / MUCL 43194) TaxID=747089 RepID=A0A2P4Q0L6_RHIID|nr:hypothetical protein GLOIN_2v1609039 [Rhizophagus irregularis DAOM 181602=DAOM 197198]POG71148.1 hypothetical protein GLOIN_2v1609039 [Rhizophagus irregularis DAOM 181602=DAOM 197198]|eukprot:XP_025178014.1 hypothetical protein GLOIN_2v1609039 [Rhizophagus irregularis DAOM 181602=DAOM 197198]